MAHEHPHEPTSDDDAAVCAYCGRRFVHEDHLALHRGLDHTDAITDAERDAYETAEAAEHEALRLFRLKAVLVLVVCYFLFFVAYLFAV
ncbi:hypothetical protein [Halococcus agarilyticus]|uniref:hypothetical protein n=1 Tax=Halococcus agarilyticus TaxID=1232219 RepID=UPI000677817E|nr:hypothetical protein [Halococcus agarilyticus]